MRKKYFGGGSLPLLIRGREVFSNISLTDRAQERICEGMHEHICVRMPGKAMRMWDTHAAQPYMIARREGMNVISLTHANIQ